MRLMSRGAVLVVAGVALGVLAGVGLTRGNAAGAAAASAPDDGRPIEEDYSYPGAADILAKYHVKLISGDGHILFADCATPPTGDIGLIKVRTNDQAGNGSGLVCFRVTSN